jgi:AraC family transcriptional activator of pobA
MRATENFTRFSEKEKNIKSDLPFQIRLLEKISDEEDCFLQNTQSNEHFEIIWITSGTGVHYIDMQECPVEDNDLFFVRPGQVHFLKMDAEFKGYVISFSESFLSIEDPETNSTYHTNLFNMFSSAKAIAIDFEGLPDMKNIAEKMTVEFESHNLFRAEILRRYFKILLIYITRQLEGSFNTERQTRNVEIVTRFMALLEKNYKTQKMVSDYASMLCVTPNYLNEIIKKTTGHSAGHQIRQRIALEAKRQARYSGNCMKEVAYFLGFVDMAHFSKFFKKATGVNFSEFKRDNFIISTMASV